MRNRYRTVAYLLAGLMLLGTPAETFASGDTAMQPQAEADGSQEEAIQEETEAKEPDQKDEMAGAEQENAGNGQDVSVPEDVLPKEDSPAGNGQGASTEPDSKGELKTEAIEEAVEIVEEEELYYDPEDPGNYRLKGKVDKASFGSSISAMAVSPGKYNDCIMEKGVDVSYYNGKIDWNAVKNDPSVDFAIVRVAYRGYSNGALKTDDKAAENLKAAKAAGVPVGAYIFSQAISIGEAVEEADYIINTINSYGSAVSVTLPIVLDYEYVDDGVGRLYKADLSKEAATDICTAFCNRVRARGYMPMVYANKTMLTNDLYAADFSQDSAVWLAHYTTTTNYEGEYEYWQYSSTGKVNWATGNKGAIDLNFRYKNSLRISGRSANSLSLKWEPYAGATSYEVWRKNGSSYQKIADVGAATTYTDSSLSPGSSYSYKIHYLVSGVRPAQSCIGFNTGITGLTATASVSAKGTGFDRVKVSWAVTPGASGYYVQRSPADSSAYDTIASLAATSYNDGNRDASTTYKYRVLPYKVIFNGRSGGNASNEVSATTLAPISGKTKSSKLPLRSGASASSKKVGTIKKKNTSVTIVGSSGSWYKLNVKISGSQKTGYLKKNKVKANDPTAVGKATLSIKSKKATKIKVGWKKVSGASGYEIQRYNNAISAYETVKTITKGKTVSWTDTGLAKNTKYKYRVRAYKNYSGDQFFGAYSSAKSAKTKKK